MPATWDEVRAHLAASSPLAVDEPGCIGVRWRLPDGQTQLVKLEPGMVADVAWLVLTADVCERERLDFDRVLRRNAGMAVGAFALLGERFILRHALPLPSLTWPDLERALQLMAAEAARARTGLHDRASALFGNYTD
jgi:hypothetical protein